MPTTPSGRMFMNHEGLTSSAGSVEFPAYILTTLAAAVEKQVTLEPPAPPR